MRSAALLRAACGGSRWAAMQENEAVPPPYPQCLNGRAEARLLCSACWMVSTFGLPAKRCPLRCLASCVLRTSTAPPALSLRDLPNVREFSLLKLKHKAKTMAEREHMYIDQSKACKNMIINGAVAKKRPNSAAKVQRSRSSWLAFKPPLRIACIQLRSLLRGGISLQAAAAASTAAPLAGCGRQGGPAAVQPLQSCRPPHRLGCASSAAARPCPLAR